MKIIYNKKNGEIVGVGGGDLPETKNQGVIEESIPADLTSGNYRMFKVADGKIEKKAGSALDEVKPAIDARMISKLMVEYFGGDKFGPIEVGQFEGVIDIILQAVNILVKGKKLSQKQEDAWDFAYGLISPHFRMKIEDILADAEQIAERKMLARNMYEQMKADPRWPK